MTAKAKAKEPEVTEQPEETVEQVNELLVLVENQLSAKEVFTNKKVLDGLLKKIREHTASLVPDLETAEGRKAIAANAYNVARSKTAIDNYGKDLVAAQKAALKEIDDRRKYARDYLDALKVETRKPLTDWEAEQERIAQAEADAAKLVADEEEAYALHELFEREAKVKAQEARLAELEAREKAAEERDRREAENKLLEERVRKEAAAEADRKVREAEERASRAEAEAAEKARAAIEGERIRKAQEEERARIQKENEEKRIAAEEQARSANIEHRRGINNQIVERLIHYGFTMEQAQQLVTLIATGKIPSTEIRY